MMRELFVKPFCLALAGALLTLPSLAVAGQTAPTATAAKPADPVICRTDDELGSRIAKRKICMKRSEWRDVGHESGQWVEQKSTYLGKPGGG